MSDRKLVSIVTPCFNEEANVRLHFERVGNAIAPFRERYDFEHIYTDNQSQDRTFALLKELAAEHSNVRAMRFSRNLGANRAIFIGLQHAQGDATILIQADLQDPPELIPDFLRLWEEGWDVAYGKILGRKENFILRTLRRQYYRMVSQLSDIPIPENAGEFRLTSRRALDAILQFEEDDLYVRGAVARIGYAQKPVPYQRAERAGGRSSISFFGLIAYGMNGLFSNTLVPLRAVIVIGFFMALLGVFLTLGLVVGKLIMPGAAPHGFTTIASLITLFAGSQMFALGIIGEYIRKIYVQSLHRPRGFIQDRVNLP
ncbi:MAG: glycosyltransferase family 2 protein [Acidobacteriota bacterium]